MLWIFNSVPGRFCHRTGGHGAAPVPAACRQGYPHIDNKTYREVEAVAEPEDWPVTEYTDDFRQYHPEDSAIWERFFFHAMFVSTDLADCLCFLRAGGAILVPDAAYGTSSAPSSAGTDTEARASTTA